MRYLIMILSLPGRFVDWFESERGTGDGQNGWVGKGSKEG